MSTLAARCASRACRFERGLQVCPLVFRGPVAPLQGRRGLEAELPKARPATGLGTARQVALALGGVSGRQRRRGFPGGRVVRKDGLPKPR